jgi:protein TonB
MNAALRFPAATFLGALVSLGVLTLMQSLVTRQNPEMKDLEKVSIVDFVRLKRASEPEVKKRELPSKREKPEAPPPAQMELSEIPSSGIEPIASVPPGLDGTLDLSGGPALGTAASDADAVPLVRVSPQYPPTAMMRGIEGWVQVQFTITTAGTVKDPKVVEADPDGYFEKAALNAVSRYKYKPKIVDGEPVERPGINLVISFKLKK